MPKMLLFVLALLASTAWLKEAAHMNDGKSIHLVRQTPPEPTTRTHAKAKITVQSSEAKPYDQTAGPALMELHLNETFTGDIDGESPVRALQAYATISLPA